MAKLPWYVESQASNGRRVYKPGFVNGLITDINIGRTTPEQAAQDFDIQRNMIYRWKAQRKHLARKPAAAANGNATGKTLADQALAFMPEAKSEADRTITAPIDQQIELAVLYITGKVSEAAVKRALGKSAKKFITTLWLGRVFAGAIRSGYHVTKP